ncbi:electron transfer flavoprotein-ubiquinone oxidoreductase [Hyphomonas sp.]|jgi:electron-transferring-flavoprotein dehydrogenase|uniref:electron transfer flavoprotein-ubiquinone oxidoreductase n=1 Tax=Hyphomonas sp. TaxID=87 RepID=UPI000C3E2F18|nr:electron transfer flavoprotein-ubiquinone oxidoreductase [Hyphomonas sp.]MBM59903.1 electron transfer flavoprotein-ubiquinone oxidoreductase [Hyphomonas sp.]
MADDAMERESMEFDLVIVGGGPSGLSAAIRFKQLANEAGEDLSVVVLEKGGEIGAHILSGVVMDPVGLDKLIPDWRTRDDRPLKTEVTADKFMFLGPQGVADISILPMPGFMKNHGNFTGSLANVTRWLGQEAENLGVEVFPGFAASEVVYGEDGRVKGVVSGVMGIAADGSHKGDYQPGMELLGKYVLFAEGARGSLTKELIAKFNLDEGRDPQKFGIGLKELWSVPEENFKEGYVQHTMGWPLDNKTGGGSFLYHFRDNGEPFISVGFVVHLNYANPYISPYQEFQRFKHHPAVLPHLEGGKRVAYGARAITEGGFQSVPKLAFPGGALIGCGAGFVNVPRIKGSHNAILTGMMGAEAAFAAIKDGRQGDTLESYEEAYTQSSVYKELKVVRNVKPLWSKLGTAIGIPMGGIEMWISSLLGGFSFFGTMKHGKTDAASLKPAKNFKPIDYPKPDGVISFDKLTNVSFTNTYHEEDQPVHLKVADLALQKSSEHDVFDGPSARYCPAGVYEWIEEGGELKFQINSQNCIHCKTCDIKDPNQNINWTVPEGGGGPAYPNM